jgi:hypothetical protein
MAYVLMAVAISSVHSDARFACSAGETVHLVALRPASCSQVSVSDLAISRGARLNLGAGLLGRVDTAANAAHVDPQLLLAVLIRESGDTHALDWLAHTPLGWVHAFSLGVSDMQSGAFNEARAYANGAINFGWSAIENDPGKAITAAAFLLAKRTSQLSPGRSDRYSDVEYVRMGYRGGYDVMRRAEMLGSYEPGVELFDLAYATAGELMHPVAGGVEPAVHGGRGGCDIV